MDADVPAPNPVIPPPPPPPRFDPNEPGIATPHFDRLVALQDAFYAILRALESADVSQEFRDIDPQPAEVGQLHEAIGELVQEGEALLDRVWFHCTSMGMELDEALAVPAAPEPAAVEDDDTRPCVQCGQPVGVDGYEGLPVEHCIDHGTSKRLQSELIARGYDPPDAPVHDDCWPAFKRRLKAKAQQPVGEAGR